MNNQTKQNKVDPQFIKNQTRHKSYMYINHYLI